MPEQRDKATEVALAWKEHERGCHENQDGDTGVEALSALIRPALEALEADNAALVDFIEEHMIVGVPDELTIDLMRKHQVETNTAASELLAKEHPGAEINTLLHEYRVDKEFGPSKKDVQESLSRSEAARKRAVAALRAYLKIKTISGVGWCPLCVSEWFDASEVHNPVTLPGDTDPGPCPAEVEG